MLDCMISSRLVWFLGARARIPRATFSTTFAPPTSATVLTLFIIISSARLAIIFPDSLVSFNLTLLKKVVLGDKRSRTTLRAIVWRTRFPFWRKSSFPREVCTGSTRRGRCKIDALIRRLKPRPIGILWVDEATAIALTTRGFQRSATRIEIATLVFFEHGWWGKEEAIEGVQDCQSTYYLSRCLCNVVEQFYLNSRLSYASDQGEILRCS